MSTEAKVQVAVNITLQTILRVTIFILTKGTLSEVLARKGKLQFSE